MPVDNPHGVKSRLVELQRGATDPPLGNIEIEAYDMDAFRDPGLHWRYLASVIDDPKFNGKLEPDPFAAELITGAVEIVLYADKITL